MTVSEELELKLKNLPDHTGVYLMKNARGKIIYIGKAINLKNRVRTYFQKGRPYDPKTEALVSKIRDFEFYVTGSEIEALILESNLVKEHKPFYNVNLKDDKRFPYLKVTVDEPFPRVLVVRRLKKDKARYFGPYTEVKKMRETLRLIFKHFKIRICNYAIPDPRGKQVKLCLEYHIKRCPGPCENLISEAEYRKQVDDVIMLLSGKSGELTDKLTARMKEASKQQEFESAAKLRDQIEALSSIRQRQRVMAEKWVDQDIMAFACSATDAACVVLQIREGVLIGRQHFYLKIRPQTTEEEIAETFLKQHYLYNASIPAEIYISVNVEERELLELWLREKAEHAVKIFVPQKGEKLKLVEMAHSNAQLLLNELLLQKQDYRDRMPESILRLQQDLRLEKTPVTMAAFDISNLGQDDKVGSLVFFEKGKPKKSRYRHFKIKTVRGQDDFASLREIVYRYYRRLQEEQTEFPDLLVIDGGKGQLSAGLDALSELKIKDQTMIGLAKKLEEVFFPGQKESLMIPKTSPALRLLQMIRNEAHRFAIEYNRKLRKKRTLKTELEDIPGIGPKKAETLLKHFGSVKKIKALSLDELIDAPGIGPSDAKKIIAHFSGK
jgi:excinuclease ABC subunit C